MPFRQRRDDALAPERRGSGADERGLSRNDRDVQCAVPQRRVEARPRTLDQADVDLRELLSVVQQGRAQIAGGQRRMEADRQPSGLAAAGAMGDSGQRVHLLQNRAGGAQEIFSRPRHAHAAARSLEYHDANRFLELANAAAQRGLPNHQSVGGSPKAPVVRRRHGISQMLKRKTQLSASRRRISQCRLVSHSSPLASPYEPAPILAPFRATFPRDFSRGSVSSVPADQY